ncbi:MAG: phosphate ABC transporter substrate-binding protein PstS family protein [Aureliella sp.]
MAQKQWLKPLFCLTIGVITCWSQPLCAQSSTAKAAAQLDAMIAAIAPYRPMKDASAEIRVVGSTSMDGLAHGWATGFSKFHKRAAVQIQGSGSEQALEALTAAPSSIAMLSRPVTDAELAGLKKRGLVNPVAIPVAREALAVYVHETNPVQAITGKQLKAIFTEGASAETLNWSMLGAQGQWSSKPIHLISRTQRCGTQTFLRDFVFGSATMRGGKSEHSSNALVLEEVRKDPLAIAICGKRSKSSKVKMLQLTAGNQVVPSDDAAILNGQYPLTRTLTLVIDADRSDPQAIATQEFVRYALGQQGQVQTLIDGFYPIEANVMRAGLAKLGSNQIR